MAPRILPLTCLLSLSLLLAGCGNPIEIPTDPLSCDGPGKEVRNLSLHTPGASSGDLAWPAWGGNLENTRNATNETLIDTSNVSQLQTKWIYTTAGSVSATPTITDNTLYVTDWGQETSISSDSAGGKVHAIDINTGTALWSKWMRLYNNDGLNNVSRSSPAIFEDLIIIADVQNPAPLTSLPGLIERVTSYLFGFGDPCGGYVYAINRHSSKLVWKTRIGSELFDQITQSPVVVDVSGNDNDRILVGVSSNESTYTRSSIIPCCKFRGSLAALNPHTGDVVWQTPMIEEKQATPNPSEYNRHAGAAVWGGAPTIDIGRNRVYIPTGNNYWIPKECERSNPPAYCDMEHNHFDSIVALDLDSGDILWDFKSRPNDAWNTACDYEVLFPLLAFSSSTENCPLLDVSGMFLIPVGPGPGPDHDFAQPPMLVRDVDLTSLNPALGIRDVLYAGTKGGVFFAIDAESGLEIWRRQVGPGGLIGGMQFGSATDGQRIYVQNTNFAHQPFPLVAGPDAGKWIQSGFWAALDPVNGSILWQTQVPGGDNPLEGSISHLVWGSDKGSGYFAWPMAAPTVANGVVFAGVANLEGTMVAMDASNGQILWQKNTGQSIGSSPSIVNGHVYWGTGYRVGNRGNRLYKLGLP